MGRQVESEEGKGLVLFSSLPLFLEGTSLFGREKGSFSRGEYRRKTLPALPELGYVQHRVLLTLPEEEEQGKKVETS